MDWLEANTDAYMACQHDADEDVETTHTHIQFTNLKLTDGALEKQRTRHNLGGSKSRLLSRVVKTRELYDEHLLNVYIVKGNVNHHRKSSYDAQAILGYAQKWVPNDALPSTPRGGGKAKSQPYDEYDVMKKDFVKYFEEMSSPRITLDLMRSWTMRWYWKRDGRMPPATSYKRNAASLYVLAVEMSQGCIETAFEELKELWY